MLADPGLSDEVEQRLAQGESAAAAWMAVIDGAARQQEALHDTLLAERAADLRDIGRRVLAQLCGVRDIVEPEQPYVLVMAEVGPSDVARLDPARVAGIVTAQGGATAHSAIVARALGIPAVVGAGAAILLLEPGTSLLLDGQRGRVSVAPAADDLQRALAERDLREQRLQAAWAKRHEPAVTRDGHAVEVFANIGESTGIDKVVEQGAEGVGLLRTELIFMAHPRHLISPPRRLNTAACSMAWAGGPWWCARWMWGRQTAAVLADRRRGESLLGGSRRAPDPAASPDNGSPAARLAAGSR